MNTFLPHNDQFPLLLRRINEAWNEMPAPDFHKTLTSTPFLEDARIVEYFTNRKVQDVNPQDVIGELPFSSGFTAIGKHYYSGPYLAYLLQVYAAASTQNSVLPADYPSIGFQRFILSSEAQNIPFTTPQIGVISDVLEIMANRIDIVSLSEEDIEHLLGAVKFWKEKRASLRQ